MKNKSGMYKVARRHYNSDGCLIGYDLEEMHLDGSVTATRVSTLPDDVEEIL